VDTLGRVYLRGMARYPGDPEAWVSSRGDVARLAASRGWGVSGMVDVKRREVEPAPDVAVAADIVADYAQELIGERGMSVDEAMAYAARVRGGREDTGDLKVDPIPAAGLDWSPDFGG
jgi:hypothetical protein